ncbi:hypothetical protein L1049_025888 [Liquidambar formosana]|uniref:non-specific serine/threonine protein kinase n=1 Tax=Liquidambar formosana TaxID=63359 RepID=A0AAP0NC43_LIQFO
MFPAEIGGSARHRAANVLPERVVVAVKAEKVISKTALAWALTHVVHPGDCITLLAIFSGKKAGLRLWNFSRLTGDRGNSCRDKLPDRICQISESCSQMVLQFHDHIEVKVRIKVVSGRPRGAVAAEAKSNAANWVVLDKKLKQEQKRCMEELRCNIVVMKGSQPKVLRLNLGCSNELQTPFFSASSSPGLDFGNLQGHRMKHSTPVSSPEQQSTSYPRTTGEVSLSSSDTVTSLFLVYEENPLFEGLNKGKYTPISGRKELDDPLKALDADGGRLITLSRPPKSSVTSICENVFWIPQNHMVDEKAPTSRTYRNNHKIKSPASRTVLDRFVQFDRDMRTRGIELNQTHHRDYFVNSSIRDAVSLGRTSSTPPPLCSICQHKAPVFGKPPRQFSYEELEEATDNFSDANFLAEGGFGLVHRGVLRDGPVVAVKQLKFAGPQGDADFYGEVLVLSCAQHRNLVLLIGFCIEGKKRVLVYEYICNGSLDFHLHRNKGSPLDWNSRLKIAIGAARGLRYLHEDCRVGCIVHRDMRPKNILLTHDFEPLVGDFGLARWHSECNINTKEQIIGTSGYLAPEYFEGGKITQKVDVYAFGVVLLELMTGQKINGSQLYKGEHFLSEWLYLLAALEPSHILARNHQLLDPSLPSDQLHNFAHQVQAMGRAASLCLRQDPECRPPMSKVLKILEGGDPVIPLSLDLNSVGSRSGHMHGLMSSQTQLKSRRSHSRTLSH